MLQVSWHQVRFLTAQAKGREGWEWRKELHWAGQGGAGGTTGHREEKKGGLVGPAGPYSTDLLSHQIAEGHQFFKAEFLTYFLKK